MHPVPPGTILVPCGVDGDPETFCDWQTPDFAELGGWLTHRRRGHPASGNCSSGDALGEKRRMDAGGIIDVEAIGALA